jgi:RNA polymerase sigma-70 factor (ECF subfamily)
MRDWDGHLDEELARDLQRRVVSAVRRTCPAWLAGQAEDISQTVLVQLTRSSQRREGKPEYATSYLEKAAYGAAVDEIRRRSRRQESPMADPAVIERAPDRGANPERRASAAETAQAIRDCLARLLRPRRLAVTLYLQGCSVPETGRRLGWKAKRADNLVYRGLADLRRCLAGKGQSP